MSTTIDGATITVALLGNPNTGKSTLFCALAGVHQRVGNYPGVTVEKRVGRARFAGREFTLVDLPGTYSLAPRSPDEMVAVDVCLGRRQDVPSPDVIVCIADASNLERHLYLVSQAMELGCPLVLALNMMDVARERGVTVDIDRLRDRLQIPVVATEAHRKVGLEDLKQAMVDALQVDPSQFPSPLPEIFHEEVTRLQGLWSERTEKQMPRFLIGRLLLDAEGYIERAGVLGNGSARKQEVQASRERLSESGCSLPGIETASRYKWVDQVLEGIMTRPSRRVATLTDRIDRILTHPVAGTLIFFALMVLVFQSIFSWATPFQDGIEQLVGYAGRAITNWMPSGVLESLLSDGVIAGVGAVLAFLPQIATLFLFVAVLEDCGYMSRAAYLMDGMMSRVGLSGKSFIPLISSFACAVPGIMSARVIEDRRDRLVTILVAPLMSCSARLPIYTLMIAAFIPDRRFLAGWLGLQGLTLLALYGLGIVVAVGMAKVLKRTFFRGEAPPFVMELPDYRIPSPRVVVLRVVEQSWLFVRGAGTLILAVTVIVWAAAYFPHPARVETEVRARHAPQVALLDARIDALRDTASGMSTGLVSPGRLEALQNQRTALETEISNEVAGAYMEQSLLGRLGKTIAPVVRPLGWDWRIGCAVIASFPAREVVIGAMGVIYNLGEGQDERSLSLQEKLATETWSGTSRPVFTVPVALSIMVFFALCAQCAATLFVIRRETASRWWPVFTFTYMSILAYVGALLTYNIGTWIAS